MDCAAPDRSRTDRLAAWDEPVTSVRFVDRSRAGALDRLGVRSIEGLLRHYPHRYIDLTTVVPLSHLKDGADVTAVGRVHEVKVKKPKPRLSVTEVALVDGTGVLIGVWFNQPYVAQRFQVGQRVAFSGRVAMDFGLKQIRAPFFELLGEEDDVSSAARVVPVHRSTEGLTTNWLRRLVTEALDAYSDVPDHLPARLRIARGLTTLSDALRQVHFPESITRAEEARRRLAYDELLTLQLGMAVRRHAMVDGRAGIAHVVDGPLVAALRSALPFPLTPDQETAVAEILGDMAAPHPMNRMLIGDVGTGKTVVAASALAVAADSGGQAAMMAPTEVLAHQYAAKVGPLLDTIGIRWASLTGSTPNTERTAALQGLADGSIAVAFGTHALVQEAVSFSNLTLAVVDEQHRFGVEQRLALRTKGPSADLLVMTATPIPRSLALTLYGDLATSYLRERPSGRRGEDHVSTRLVTGKSRDEAYGVIRDAVEAGRQAYVVCALVDESEATEARAATREVEALRGNVFPDLRVGLLTGRMRPAEKVAAMDAFRRGETQVLVATTVIEVGVDVPNATVMLVENAERFGLAQLHQLRGRVGRGEHAGTFLLAADPKTDEGRRRMEAIVTTNDGFLLAEEDLRLRGEGQLLGERQHGMPELRLASIERDRDLLEAAREDARSIVSADPHLEAPEHAPLGREAKRRFGRDWIWTSSG